MSSSIIWIVIPFISGLVLWFFRQHQKRLILAGSIISFLLMLLALIVPIVSATQPGGGLRITSSTVFFGRQFVLGSMEQPVLAVLYGLAFLWLLGLFLLPQLSRLVPYGLVFMALTVASIAVKPFLYGALLLEIVVLLSIPLLISTSPHSGKGVLRYLIFFTIFVPLMLIAGWAANLADANPSSQMFIQRAALFMALGFGIPLAVFPFFTWITMLFEETDVYVTGFVVTLISFVVLWMGLNFLDRFGWLRTIEVLPFLLRLVGSLMILVGGVLAGFERNLKKLPAYVVIMQNGFALLALSLRGSAPVEGFASLIIPRLIMMMILCSAIAKLDTENQLEKLSLYRNGFTVVAGLIALLSFSGLPVLAVFPPLVLVISGMAKHTFVLLILVLIGLVGMLSASIQFFMRGVSNPHLESAQHESYLVKVMYSIGIASSFLLGLFPSKILAITNSLNQFFQNWK